VSVAGFRIAASLRHTRRSVVRRVTYYLIVLEDSDSLHQLGSCLNIVTMIVLAVARLLA